MQVHSEATVRLFCCRHCISDSKEWFYWHWFLENLPKLNQHRCIIITLDNLCQLNYIGWTSTVIVRVICAGDHGERYILHALVDMIDIYKYTLLDMTSRVLLDSRSGVSWRFSCGLNSCSDAIIITQGTQFYLVPSSFSAELTKQIKPIPIK